MLVCAEGVVAFPSSPARTFSYRVLSEAKWIKFWLEDRASKHQWESCQLGVKDLTMFDKSFLAVSIDAYRSIFQSCLEAVVCNKTNDCVRDLVEAKDSGNLLHLVFTMHLKVFAVVWTPKITIEMTPIHLEPIQIADAKLRDCEQELSALRLRVVALEEDAERLRVKTEDQRVLFLECDGNSVKKGELIRWKRCEHDVGSSQFNLHANGRIEFQNSDVYIVTLTVRYPKQKRNAGLFVLSQRGADGKDQNRWYASTSDDDNMSRTCVVTPSIGDNLFVKSEMSIDIQAGSTLSIVLFK